MSEDLIRRIDAVNELAKFLGVPARAFIHEAENLLKEVPSAQQNRIARETAGKSPDEIYDFLHWLLIDYGRQFTDSRAAVIEWLKEENNG